jgi:hypothetical protein
LKRRVEGIMRSCRKDREAVLDQARAMYWTQAVMAASSFSSISPAASMTMWSATAR